MDALTKVQRTSFLLAAAAGLVAIATPAHAYIGPGAGFAPGLMASRVGSTCVSSRMFPGRMRVAPFPVSSVVAAGP